MRLEDVVIRVVVTDSYGAATMVVKATVDSYMLMETVCFKLRDCKVAGDGQERDVRQL